VRNIFLFIRRYFNVLLFLILEIFSLSMLFTYNRYHEAFMMGITGDFTGKFYTQYSKVRNYFHLKEENERLARQNLALLKALPQNYQTISGQEMILKDSIPVDSLGHFRKFIWRSADVINNTVQLAANNYITLDKGVTDSIDKDMGVIGPDGVVGTVVNVSPHVCVVMSLLHRSSKVSGMLAKSKDAGAIDWDGSAEGILTMKNIPKSVKVAKGDTVVTSTYSDKFPAGIPIGTIESIGSDPASNFYVLKIRSSTHFGRLQHVYVVENTLRTEQINLESDAKKKWGGEKNTSNE
jgi:rod shape-determining protein MreC